MPPIAILIDPVEEARLRVVAAQELLAHALEDRLELVPTMTSVIALLGAAEQFLTAYDSDGDAGHDR